MTKINESTPSYNQPVWNNNPTFDFRHRSDIPNLTKTDAANIILGETKNQAELTSGLWGGIMGGALSLFPAAVVGDSQGPGASISIVLAGIAIGATTNHILGPKLAVSSERKNLAYAELGIRPPTIIHSNDHGARGVMADIATHTAADMAVNSIANRQRND
ncbi:MAG: hypothetical protein ACJA1M_000834 [Alphaproteobacteria bacterium]|jgi:hypothetical protein